MTTAQAQPVTNGVDLESLQKTIAGGESVEILRTECNLTTTHRQVVTITTSPLIDSRGGFSGAVMVIRDETRLNDLERDLNERRQFHHIIGQNRQMQKIYWRQEMSPRWRRNL